jgi:predicted RNA-binding protein associated with RNAse of E/G family
MNREELGEAARRMKGLGFEKPGGRVSYWSDASFLFEEEDVVYFGHGMGMAFHYPKRGFIRPCTVPCAGFIDLRTRTAGYVMKKWRVYDLIPEALSDDLAHPWRRSWEAVDCFPTSFYVNVCDPDFARFDQATGHLFLRDWYVDVVRVVIARSVTLTEEEAAVRADLGARGLLEREVPLFHGGFPDVAEVYAPEIVDADELSEAVRQGALSARDARRAEALAQGTLAQCLAGRGAFAPALLQRALEAAFALPSSGDERA